MRWPVDSFNTGMISNGFDAVNHQGNDIAVPKGTPIHAPESGKVSAINSGWSTGGYFGGNYVKVAGDSGYTYYMGHMDSTSTSLNARVSEGQVIGNVGQTGNATGPHIHFEMTRGNQVLDPSKIITNQPQGEDMLMQDADVAELWRLWLDGEPSQSDLDAFRGKSLTDVTKYLRTSPAGRQVAAWRNLGIRADKEKWLQNITDLNKDNANLTEKLKEKQGNYTLVDFPVYKEIK